MPRRPPAAAAAMAQQRLHLRVPLRMRGSAKAETMCKETAPIVSIPVGVCESLAKQVALSLFAMPVMQVAPIPRGQCLILVTFDLPPGHALVQFRLRFEQALKG